MFDEPGRFVVLTHDHPFLHWDLMLEQAGVLRTWRLLSEPDAAGDVIAERLPDHRLDYFDYEGPVSGGRGQVCRWDRGFYTHTEDSSERMVCEVAGGRLAGIIVLTTSADSEEWLFRYSPR